MPHQKLDGLQMNPEMDVSHGQKQALTHICGQVMSPPAHLRLISSGASHVLGGKVQEQPELGGSRGKGTHFSQHSAEVEPNSLRQQHHPACRCPADKDVLEKLPLGSLFLENRAATFLLALHRANRQLEDTSYYNVHNHQDMARHMGTITRKCSTKFLARNIAILCNGWSPLSTVPQH